MKRQYLYRGHNVIYVTVVILLVLSLVTMLIWSYSQGEAKKKEWEKIIAEMNAEREEEEKNLSIKMENCDMWKEETLPVAYEVIEESDAFISSAILTSAYKSNAKITWNNDFGNFSNDKAYVWRFWAKSENEKTLSVSIGKATETYVIDNVPTLIYIKLNSPQKLSVKVEGGKENFGEIIIGDIEIIAIDRDNADAIEYGQLLPKDKVETIIHWENIQNYNTALTANRGSFTEISALAHQDWKKVKKVGIWYTVEMGWDFESIDWNTSDVLMLNFTARSLSGCGQLRVSINGKEYVADRNLTTQNQEYAFPITGLETINSLGITVECSDKGFSIGNLKFFKAEGESTKLPGGVYLVDTYTETTISSDERVAEAATACLVDDQYLYTLNSGKLTVFELDDNKNIKGQISQLQNLGDVREMVFVKNGDVLAISARENGVWFIDVSNPENLAVLSHYDTLEMATGISAYGDYIAVCSRYFGVEIVDVSDITKPKYCASVSNDEEYYDCFISDGFLYVGVWANQCVEIYDLSNVYKPVSAGKIVLDGNGAGCFVDNGILYVATGYNGQGKADDEFASAFGTGTGMEIWNVSNPSAPVWMATCKIDGRYNITGFDHWKVSVSNGKAYLSSVSNGIYIFDVSNPYEPVRTEHIAVTIPAGSENHKALSGVNILPDGGDGSDREIIADMALANGMIYIAGYRDGTYLVADPEVKAIPAPNGNLSGKKKETYNEVQIKGYKSTVYMPENGAVYATATYQEHIYAACGSDGIAILDENLNLLQKVPTIGEVKDIVISNGFLYTAEGEKGLGVYSIIDNSVNRIDSCTIENKNSLTFSQLQLSGDEKHLLVQGGWSLLIVIDISNPEHPIISDQINVGLMYNRNLCNGLVRQSKNSYMGVFSRGEIVWFDAEGNQVKSMANGLTGEMDGAAAIGNKVLVMNERGYYLFDPILTEESDYNSLVRFSVEDVNLRGKPVVYNDLLVLSYGYGKVLTLVDISNEEQPKLIAQVKVDGNPDVAEITDDYILVPMRRQGLLMLTPKDKV